MRVRNQLCGGVAVVTGGAGEVAGLGGALVRQFAEAGMRVAILDIDGAAAERLAKLVRSTGGDALGLQVDVTDLDALIHAADRVRETYGQCNVLCAHVGGGGQGTFDSLSIVDWRESLELMVLGSVATVQAFLPMMRLTDGRRRIVLTSSVAALAPGRYQGPYRAAKAAVTSLGETLDAELSPEGIGATVVFPSGMVPAELVDLVRQTVGGGSQETDLPIFAAIAAEMVSDPLDIASGEDAAAPVIDAIVSRKPYVLTHGTSVIQRNHERQSALDEAFTDALSRQGKQ